MEPGPSPVPLAEAAVTALKATERMASTAPPKVRLRFREKVRALMSCTSGRAIATVTPVEVNRSR